MSTVNEILARLQAVVDHPATEIKDYLDKKETKAIGYMYYAPQELVHAAGMLPVGLWGGAVEPEAARNYLPAFYCGILQTSLEMGIKGMLNILSGVIIPANCDALRGFGENWKAAVPQVEFISIVPPFNRKTEPGKKYMMTEYEVAKKALERISGNAITDEKLKNSISVFNKYRQVIRGFVKTAAKYPEIITPSLRNTVIKSGCFMDKETYTALVADLTEQLNTQPVQPWTGKKVVVSGIKMDSPAILKALEENHVAVVADDLAQETRQFRKDVAETSSNPLENLANYWAELEGCSLLFDPEKQRCNMIMDEIKATDADGVLFCMTKFCDPEEFDYPIFKKKLDAANISQIYIETDLEVETDEQARTRIQAFSEMVN